MEEDRVLAQDTEKPSRRREETQVSVSSLPLTSHVTLSYLAAKITLSHCFSLFKMFENTLPEQFMRLLKDSNM